MYVFCYTRCALQSDRFFSFPSLPDLDVVYVSGELFPSFDIRILNKKRSEFKGFLRWLSLDENAYDLFDILALTEVKRETDRIKVFSYPKMDNNTLTIDFFAHCVGDVNDLYKGNLTLLRPGDKLFLCQDRQNTRVPGSILLRSDDPIALVGYCQHYLLSDLNILLDNGSDSDSKIKAYIKKINIDAPYCYMILCTLETTCPSNFLPYSGDQFLPIPNETLLMCQNDDSKIRRV